MSDLKFYLHLIYIYDEESTDTIENPWEFQYLLWDALHESHRN